MDETELTSCGIVPVRDTGEGYEYLLIQHWLGHWGFPKGMPEPGESRLDTARREFEEETGIRDWRVVESAVFSEEYKPVYQGVKREKTVHYYLGVVAPDAAVNVQVEEVKDYTWVRAARAKDLLARQADAVVESVEAWLATHKP